MRYQTLALAALLFAALAGVAPAQQQPVTAKSPDGSREASAKDKTISVTETRTGKELMRMRAHTQDITALAFSPDGKLLASADRDGKVLLFDGATGKQIRELKAAPGVNVVKFSADGAKIEAKAPGATMTFAVATGKLEK